MSIIKYSNNIFSDHETAKLVRIFSYTVLLIISGLKENQEYFLKQKYINIKWERENIYDVIMYKKFFASYEVNIFEVNAHHEKDAFFLKIL